jgi:rhodanese-related sulfurtransferase
MADLNRAGVPMARPTPLPSLDLLGLQRFLAEGGWAVDLRPRGAFAAAHVPGTVNVEYGQSFTMYAGSILPWPGPLALLADDAQTVVAAQLDLSRIGMDQTVGQMLAPVEKVAGRRCETAEARSRAAKPTQSNSLDLSSYPVAARAELLAGRRRPELLILDVRRRDEWLAGHLEEATHVPLADLSLSLGDLPAGTIWVHCASGYRAGIAASLLARAGRQVVLVDGEVLPVAPAAAA